MARRSDHSKEEIIEMAIQAGKKIMSEDGFSNFSARAAAREIGYTVNTIHNVFEGHDNYILHINAVTLDDMREFISEHINKKDKGAKAVKKLARLYIEFAEDNYNLWSALFEFNLPQDVPLPDWYEDKIKELFEIVEAPLLPLLDNDIKLSERAAKVIWAGIHGICQLGLTGKLDTVGAESIEILTDSLIKNYINGLK
ncbi:MAG: TetR-like C-terminal domain-containing protein [Rickettsiales bacterium]